MPSGYCNISNTTNVGQTAASCEYITRKKECLKVFGNLQGVEMLRTIRRYSLIEKIGDKALGIRGRHDSRCMKKLIFSLPNDMGVSDLEKKINNILNQTGIMEYPHLAAIHRGEDGIDGVVNRHVHVSFFERKFEAGNSNKNRVFNKPDFIELFRKEYQHEFGFTPSVTPHRKVARGAYEAIKQIDKEILALEQEITSIEEGRETSEVKGGDLKPEKSKDAVVAANNYDAAKKAQMATDKRMYSLNEQKESSAIFTVWVGVPKSEKEKIAKLYKQFDGCLSDAVAFALGFKERQPALKTQASAQHPVIQNKASTPLQQSFEGLKQLYDTYVEMKSNYEEAESQIDPLDFPEGRMIEDRRVLLVWKNSELEKLSPSREEIWASKEKVLKIDQKRLSFMYGAQLEKLNDFIKNKTAWVAGIEKQIEVLYDKESKAIEAKYHPAIAKRNELKASIVYYKNGMEKAKNGIDSYYFNLSGASFDFMAKKALCEGKLLKIGVFSPNPKIEGEIDVEVYMVKGGQLVHGYFDMRDASGLLRSENMSHSILCDEITEILARAQEQEDQKRDIGRGYKRGR